MIEVIDHPKTPKLHEIAADLRVYHSLKTTGSADLVEATEMFHRSERFLEEMAAALNNESGNNSYIRLSVGERTIQSFIYTKISRDHTAIRPSHALQPRLALPLRHFHQKVYNYPYHLEPLMYAGNLSFVHSEIIAETLSQNGTLDIVIGPEDQAGSLASA